MLWRRQQQQKPGKVISVHVTPGEDVDSGKTMFILESMKMQFEVKSTKAGQVKSVLVATGEQVNAGQTLGEWA